MSENRETINENYIEKRQEEDKLEEEGKGECQERQRQP